MVLGAAGCGGGDDTTSTPAAGASGTSGPQGSGGGMTAKEFVDASIPDEVNAVKEAVEAAGSPPLPTPARAATSRSTVAVDATTAAPDTPLDRRAWPR